MKNEFIEKAINVVGSQSALAKIVGHPQSLVSAWLRGKRRVSVDAVPLIVKITDEQVKPYQLRPDLPNIFPHPSPKSGSADE
ncbi:YdaS family helix-turn-helix protein [Yersinia enterocolitica]